MHRRTLIRALAPLAAGLALTAPRIGRADASGPQLGAYYSLQAWLSDGRIQAWSGERLQPRRWPGTPPRWAQVAVNARQVFGLSDAGELWRWQPDADTPPLRLMQGVAHCAAGNSGWMAVDGHGQLWRSDGADAASARAVRGAMDAAQACVGDGADYWIGRDGRLWVLGLAHRGQYGDGRLQSQPDWVSTAQDIVAVRAHTGHAIALRRDGTVLGTGGNRFGPLSRHGLGDKADRWGPIFEGARQIATGSRHSLAIRADGSLWAWGDGFQIEPRLIAREVLACAAGDSATLALLASGECLQWDRGRELGRVRSALGPRGRPPDGRSAASLLA